MFKNFLGKNLKSILLTWKKNFFRLNSIGMLNVYDVNDRIPSLQEVPTEIYNLMGGCVQYEQNKVISYDDCRGNCLVVRCATQNQNSSSNNNDDDDELFLKWKNAFDSQIIVDRNSEWIRPNHPLNSISNSLCPKPIKNLAEKKVLIVDIGTCSIRAGLYNSTPQLPQLFIPSDRGISNYGILRV